MTNLEVMIGNLRQGEVIVVIELGDFPLLVGEHLTVKIEQIRNTQILRHVDASFM